VISSSECDVVLFVVLCGIVWFHVLLWCSFVPIERSTSVNQLQIQSMIWTSTLHIQKHGYSGDLDLIILFVGIMLLYVINLDVVSIFAVSSFTFLAILIMLLYLMYYIDLNEWISFCFCQKNNNTCLKSHISSKNINKILVCLHMVQIYGWASNRWLIALDLFTKNCICKLLPCTHDQNNTFRFLTHLKLSIFSQTQYRSTIYILYYFYSCSRNYYCCYI